MKSCKPTYSLYSSLPKLLLLAGFVSLLGACTSNLNTSKLEEEIKKGLEEQTKLEFKSVSCPDSIKIEKEDTFDCEAETTDGKKETIAVTQTDDEGNVTWLLKTETASQTESGTPSTSTSDQPSPSTSDSPTPSAEPVDPNAKLVDAQEVESTITTQFTAQSGIAVDSVACPEKVAAKDAATFECQVSAKNGKKITAIVTQKGTDGNFSWNATKGLISLSKVEELIKNGIKNQRQVDVTPKCEGKFTIAYAGESFNCSATSTDGKNIPVKVDVKSDDGQVEVSWNF